MAQKTVTARAQGWERLEFVVIGLRPGVLADNPASYVQGAWDGAIVDENGARSRIPAKERSPMQQFEEARYVLDPARDGALDGIPALAFQRSIQTAPRVLSVGTGSKAITQAKMKNVIRVLSEGDGLIPILDAEAEPFGWKVKGGSIQWRALYKAPWRARLVVEFNSDAISAGDLAALVERAGDSIGVGGWRPDRGGIYGRFEIQKA